MSENPFIARLEDLARREDRGALAALRRGLGLPPGAAAEMHPYVAPFLSAEAWTWRHQCHYIVAALFGLHPAAGGTGNFGETFRGIRQATGQPGGGDDSTEKRFMALLKCHHDDLFDHLRQAVSLAKSKNVAVNWEQLLKDIQYWDTDDARVQRRWSQAYWGGREVAAVESTEPSTKESQA
jgi:CRISPR system Cascade subunit CasB